MPVNPNEFTWVTNAKTAKLLVDTKKFGMLMPFLDRICTVKEAAEERKISASRMSYWVQQMLAADLIMESARRHVGSKTTPTYTSTSKAFAVKLDDMPYETLEEIFSSKMQPIFETLQNALVHLTQKNKDLSLEIFRAKDGIVVHRLTQPNSDPIDLNHVHIRAGLRLNEGDKVALFREMNVLFNKYLLRVDPTESNKTILYMVAVPTLHESK